MVAMNILRMMVLVDMFGALTMPIFLTKTALVFLVCSEKLDLVQTLRFVDNQMMSSSSVLKSFVSVLARYHVANATIMIFHSTYILVVNGNVKEVIWSSMTISMKLLAQL